MSLCAMHLLLPLISSLLYVTAALFLKQATRHQVGVWRAAFVCNWTTALLFLGLWPLGGTIPGGALLWQPAVVALLFLAGQIFTFMALEQGDVSVATPVLSTKVVLVALFTTLVLPGKVSARLWVAAGLSCLGILLLNRGGRGTRHHHVVRTVGLALQAAVAYALFDVLVIKWSPRWGVGRFLPILMLCTGLYSLIFIPMFHQPLRSISRPAWRILIPGALCIALQGMLIIITLAVFGDATSVNVVYSSRGLWSVLAVWWVGGWFENTEHQLGGAVLHWRLLGALLLSAAMVIVFV
jgi:drug/metabolite transporter (DMT)-like permease